MYDLLVKTTPEQTAFLAAVAAAMEEYFGADRKRIEHARQVAAYARQLLAYIEADPVLTLSAAYLHDIGIHAAERRHGSNSGRWQEVEGPPIARAMLAGLAAETTLIERVAEIVGSHHTPAGVASAEFRILWDADALVNFADTLALKTDCQVAAILDRHMVTEAGLRMARELFMQDPRAHVRDLTGYLWHGEDR